MVIDLKTLGKWQSLKHKVKLRDKDFQGHSSRGDDDAKQCTKGTMGPKKKIQKVQSHPSAFPIQ